MIVHPNNEIDVTRITQLKAMRRGRVFLDIEIASVRNSSPVRICLV
jgi:hypothetical protein